jgi:hypothetical protein
MIRLSKSAHKANALLAEFSRVFWVDPFVTAFDGPGRQEFFLDQSCSADSGGFRFQFLIGAKVQSATSFRIPRSQ